MQACKDLHIAKKLSGMALSNVILGIVHAMSHKIGKIFDIAHGYANAIYLSYAIEFNKKVALKDYADIARTLKLTGSNNEELVYNLVKYNASLREKINLAHNLKDFGLGENFFISKLEEIASVSELCTSTNPRVISVDEIKKLFTAIYYGTKVDF